MCNMIDSVFTQCCVRYLKNGVLETLCCIANHDFLNRMPGSVSKDVFLTTPFSLTSK